MIKTRSLPKLAELSNRFVHDVHCGDRSDRCYTDPDVGIRIEMPHPDSLRIDGIEGRIALVENGIAQLKVSGSAVPTEVRDYLRVVRGLVAGASRLGDRFKVLRRQVEAGLVEARNRIASEVFEELRPIFADETHRVVRHTLRFREIDRAFTELPCHRVTVGTVQIHIEDMMKTARKWNLNITKQ